MQWPYLGCFTVASFTLLVASMALGIVCRLNFGKGLKEYRESFPSPFPPASTIPRTPANER
jgi:hypothetical protein